MQKPANLLEHFDSCIIVGITNRLSNLRRETFVLQFYVLNFPRFTASLGELEMIKVASTINHQTIRHPSPLS
jgi:hypothetical protein